MIAMLQRLSRRHTSAIQQAKEGSPFLRGDPQYTGRMGTPGTPFYRENGDPGSPFSRDPQNFMTPADDKNGPPGSILPGKNGPTLINLVRELMQSAVANEQR